MDVGQLALGNKPRGTGIESEKTEDLRPKSGYANPPANAYPKRWLRSGTPTRQVELMMCSLAGSLTFSRTLDARPRCRSDKIARRLARFSGG